MTNQDTLDGGPAAGIANAGLIRPPFIFLSAILLGVILNLLLPIPIVTASLSRLGIGPTLGGLILGALSGREFRSARTPVRGDKPATTVVTTGPYSFTRNPIYLAFITIQLGLAIWINTLWIIVTLIPAATLISLIVIPREEQYMEKKFGTDYLDYKASVRRWL